MAFVTWKAMSTAQRVEATRLRPNWRLDDFKDFAFWIKPDGHVSRRGGHHEMVEDAFQRIMERYTAEPRTKGDLGDWKPGVTFHFDTGRGQP